MKPAVIVSILSFFVAQAHAQYIGGSANAQFGIGLHGGAGVCQSYDGQVPDGLVDVQDDIDDLTQDIKELKSEIRKMEDKREDIEDDITTYENLMCAAGGGLFKDTVCEGVRNHLLGRPAEDPAYWTPGPNGKVCDTEDEKEMSPWPNFCKKGTDGKYSQEANSWGANAVMPAIDGKIQLKACSHNAFTVAKYLKPSNARAREVAAENCKESLKQLEDLYAEKLQYTEEAENALELQVAALESKKKRLKKDRDDIIDEAEEERTEATFCYWCKYKNDKPISTTQKVGSLLLGGLGAYLGYKGYKYGVDQAAKLGYPVAANPAVVMGGILPSVSMGIYGATNGFGAGGCGAGSPLGMYGPGGLYGTGLYPQGGGVFGYPASMGGGMGGGMYMPGMGSWGMNGPWGGGMGGMYPGMGVPMAGGYPIGGGGMIMGGIGGGIGGMMMGGYPMGGGGMIMGGYPIGGGGMIMGGGAIGGAIGGGGMIMGGYPMSGGAGMYMGGYPMGGGGMMMGGITGGGMFMGGGAGMYMGGAGGMMMGGGGYMGGAASLQMQQQMLQMQQQQTQAWIQAQQQAQQDAYQRQQTVGQLQSQLVQIQMQIQQVQTGVYGSGYASGGYGVAPYPGQNPTAPYPGGPGYQQQPYPGGGPGYQPGYPGGYPNGPVAPYPGNQFPGQGGNTSARGGR